MAESVESNAAPGSDLQVAMPDVVRFIRQLAHDLRNDLNAAELQSAYLIEIAGNDEVKEEVKRLRGMIAQLSLHLQGVTAALGQVKLNPITYSAVEFVVDLRQKLGAAYPDHRAKIEWSVAAENTELQIDPQFLLPAVIELFANAFRHDPADGAIAVEAREEKGRFVLTIREPKRGFERSTENWGREPFRTIGQGHYGLGLHRTRLVVEAHDGQLTARFDPTASSLVSTVSLPAAPPGP